MVCHRPTERRLVAGGQHRDVECRIGAEKPAPDVRKIWQPEGPASFPVPPSDNGAPIGAGELDVIPAAPQPRLQHNDAIEDRPLADRRPRTRRRKGAGSLAGSAIGGRMTIHATSTGLGVRFGGCRARPTGPPTKDVVSSQPVRDAYKRPPESTRMQTRPGASIRQILDRDPRPTANLLK